MRPIRAIIASGRAAAIITYRSRLQFAGADASTTFTDDTGKTWAAFGNAQIDTSLGDQRGQFDGAGDYITTPNHADLVFGTGDFRIAFTVRFTSKAGFQTICSKGYTANVNGSWLLQTGNGDGRMNFYQINAGSSTLVCGDTTSTINAGTDYDIEVARVSGTTSMKVNATTVASAPNPTNYNSTTELGIGGGSSSGFNNFWLNARLKDFRIS